MTLYSWKEMYKKHTGTALHDFLCLDFRSSLTDIETEGENLGIWKSLLEVRHKVSENNFCIVLMKVTLNHTTFLSAFHFLGTCQAINSPSPVVELGFLSTNRVAGVCLATDISWLGWSLQKCWCELFGRQWGENGHSVLFTPSSRYSFSRVRLPVNSVLSDGSFEMPHDCCKSRSLKGKLSMRLSVMYVTATGKMLESRQDSSWALKPKEEWMVCAFALASPRHFSSSKSLE